MLKSLYVFHSPEKVEKLEKISRRGAPRHGSCRSRIRACYVEKSPRIKRRASTIIRESRVHTTKGSEHKLVLIFYRYRKTLIFLLKLLNVDLVEQNSLYEFLAVYRINVGNRAKVGGEEKQN